MNVRLKRVGNPRAANPDVAAAIVLEQLVRLKERLEQIVELAVVTEDDVTAVIPRESAAIEH